MDELLTHRGVVYPWHCDHVGHMNNVWYAAKFDEASWNVLLQLGVTPSYLRDNGRGMAAVQQSTSFLHELLAGDVVEVRSRILEVRDKVVRFEHAMYNAETGVAAATCAITGVHIDTAARRSCPLPPAILVSARRLVSAKAA